MIKSDDRSVSHVWPTAFARPVLAAVFGLAAVAVAPRAEAAGLDQRFIGNWSGTASITDYASGDQKAMNREIVIDIRKVGNEGFEVYNSLVTTTSETEMKVVAGRTGPSAMHTIFQPTGVPGHWAAQKTCNDPAKKIGCAWARLDGDTLVIDLFAIDKDGVGQLSSNKRTLTADGMKITFRRMANGEVSRIAEGTLKKAP